MQSRERADSELGEHVKKAVSPVEAAPKAKHVRAIIVYAWDYRTTKPIWNVLRMHPVLTDQVQGFKALILIHKLLVGGPQIALEEAMSSACATFLDTCLNTLGSNNLGLGYGALVRAYIRYLRRKIQFHAAHPQYSGNFDYEDYVSLHSVGNLDEGYQSLTDLTDFIGEALMFGNSIFDQLGTFLGSGQAGAGECRTSALVPLVEESGGLFKYMTSMLMAMHLCVEQPEVLQPLVVRYLQLFSGFSSFYQKCRLNNFLHGLVSIPEIPDKPTEFTKTLPESSKEEKNSSEERGLKYYEEEKYIVPAENAVEDEAAIQALKAMHEKYVQVKRQLLYISKEHQLVLNELEQATLASTQSREYRSKYENVMKLYNELRERFVSQAKEHKMIEEELTHENNKMREQLNRNQYFEEKEDPFATECFDDDDDLDQVLKLITLVQERLNTRGAGGKIPELADAIAELLRRAIIMEDIIVDSSDSADRKELYCKNPVWSKGLISAAQSIGTSTELLAENFLQEDDEEGKEEKARAAAIQVNAGVMQLVSAARVKAPPQSAELDALLEAAGIVAFLIKNLNHQKASSTAGNSVDDKEMDDTEQKISVMNLRVEVLKREKELERAREELARMRKANYSQPNQ